MNPVEIEEDIKKLDEALSKPSRFIKRSKNSRTIIVERRVITKNGKAKIVGPQSHRGH